MKLKRVKVQRLTSGKIKETNTKIIVDPWVIRMQTNELFMKKQL